MDLQGEYVVTRVVLYNRCGPGALGARAAAALRHLPPWPMHVQPLCRQEVPERLTYFEVYVGNVDFPTITSIGNPVCGIYEAPTKSVFTFDCSPQPMAGQYVTVHLRAQAQLPPGTSPVRDGYLTVCEIQVFGYQAAYPPSPPPPPPIPSLLSQGKPVIQSSTYLDPSKFIYDASLAVDGKTDPVRPKVSAAACSDAHARVGDRRRGPSPWSPPPPHALPCMQVFANRHCASTMAPDFYPGNWL